MKTREHYVCKGECEGVSKAPVSCGAKECSLHNKPLVRCDCADGKHVKVLGF